MGEVGNFWVDKGKLIKALVPLADGVDNGLFVKGP
jgi:hypothetical protein